jgi:hypothetical protein
LRRKNHVRFAVESGHERDYHLVYNLVVVTACVSGWSHVLELVTSPNFAFDSDCRSGDSQRHTTMLRPDTCR